MESRQTILSENKAYWTDRASGYSEVNQVELETDQRKKWSDCLHGEIVQHFPGIAAAQLRVLEIGTGPGFFAILLCELGYDVTAIDLTPAMLDEAKKNAGDMADSIRFMEMNAEALDFEDASFDVVISRNLTWNLPHPDAAYAEWARVLRPGGLLVGSERGRKLRRDGGHRPPRPAQQHPPPRMGFDAAARSRSACPGG